MIPPVDVFIRHGTVPFRRVNLAMFAGGFATFGLLYCVQPLMPEFSRRFGVSAHESALSLSLPSAALAVSVLFAGYAADAWGRKTLMNLSLLSSALIMALAAAAPTWHSFLGLRALLGFTLGGLPSVGMTYLAEEVHPNSLGLGMGLYIGGNAAGGMVGRLLAGVLTDFFGWRAAIGSLAAIACAAAVLFARYLPPPRHSSRKTAPLLASVALFRGLFRDRVLPWLFGAGCLLMGSFVTVYNYIGYRLTAPPYSMNHSTVGLIFGVYVIGMFSSSWIGHLAARLGRGKVLWSMVICMMAGLSMTLVESVAVIVAGIAVITFGFFGGHSIVSSWVGRRAGTAVAQASSTYVFVYYMGSSLAGVAGGWCYSNHGWHGVAAFVGCLAAAALMIAWRLYYLPPLPARPASVRL